MSVTFQGDVIHLEGDCRVEDAEALLTLLQAQPSSMVDLSVISHLHTAVFQILLAFKPQLTGQVGDIFLKNHLVPLLT